MLMYIILVCVSQASELNKKRFLNIWLQLQMICSCFFLYILRRWKMITFTVRESLTFSDSNTTTLVPLATLKKTFPLAGAYLLYMVHL